MKPVAYYRDPECGGTAFFLLKTAKEGEEIKAIDHLLITGEKPQSGEQMKCGTCGQFIRDPSTRNIINLF